MCSERLLSYDESAGRQRIVDDSNFAIDGGSCDFDGYYKQRFLEEAERIVSCMAVVELNHDIQSGVLRDTGLPFDGND